MICPEDVDVVKQACGCTAYAGPLGNTMDFVPCDACRAEAYGCDPETLTTMPPASDLAETELPF